MTRKGMAVTGLLAIGALFTTRGARAQDVSGSASASGSVTASAPAAPSIAPTTTVSDTAPDHDKFVGHFALGYFGLTNLPIALGTTATGINNGSVAAPVIGARYWLLRGVGIDAGIGFATTSGSTEVSNGTNSNSVDKPSQLGFALHGGVPLALAAGHHFTFEVVPEVNLGFTSGTIKGVNNAPDTNLSGFLFNVGARAGAEIHFGFIGVPELALEGSVGLYLQRQATKVKTDPNSVSDGSWTFGTTVGSNPWAIFTNNISALYYF